jgi:hypothetical protein
VESASFDSVSAWQAHRPQVHVHRRAEKLRETDELRKLKYENQFPHHYEVVSADGMVGEMGLRHPKRWELTSEESTEGENFMEHLKDSEAMESKGIGMKLTKARKSRGKKAEKDSQKEKNGDEEVTKEVTKEDSKDETGNEEQETGEKDKDAMDQEKK